MSDTIKLKAATTFKYQSNLGDEIQDLEFDAGQDFAVLKEWESFYLVKDDDGEVVWVSTDERGQVVAAGGYGDTMRTDDIKLSKKIPLDEWQELNNFTEDLLGLMLASLDTS